MSFKEFMFSWYGCFSYFLIGSVMLLYIKIIGLKDTSSDFKMLVGGVGAILFSIYIAWELLKNKTN